MNCLLPWRFETLGGELQYRRDILIKSNSFYCVWLEEGGWTLHNKSYKDRIFFENAENAMKELDKILIDDGYILIPEGKEDMYKVLL